MGKSIVPPVIIDIISGAGCPGGWNGLDFRKSSQQAAQEVKDVLNKIDFSNEEKAKSDIKKLSTEEGQTAAKGAGCGGRRARATYIYSGSVKPDPQASASWARKQAILSQSGFMEKDQLKPTTVSTDDWKVSVEDFSNYATAKDIIDINNAAILKNQVITSPKVIPPRFTQFTLLK